MPVPHPIIRVEKIARFIDDFTKTDAEFQSIEKCAMDLHDERLAAEARFDNLDPKEKTHRYQLNETILALNDTTPNQVMGDLGSMKEIIEIYLCDTPEHLKALKTQCATQSARRPTRQRI